MAPSSSDLSGISGVDERVYLQLCELITSGQFPPGAWLREASVAERIGVSRTPVREALRRLDAEGIVEISRNKGAQVVSFSPEDLAGLYDIRAVLESHAVALAVPRLRDNDIANLSELAGRMEKEVKAGNISELGELNRNFHEVFIERSGNRHFSAAVQTLIRPAVIARTFRTYSPESLNRSMGHHSELIAAALVGDGEWGEAVMRAHILAAKNAVGQK